MQPIMEDLIFSAREILCGLHTVSAPLVVHLMFAPATTYILGADVPDNKRM